MNISQLFSILIFTVILQSTCSIIITSVYAGRKKFKTYSFDWLLPPVVLERANKLGFSFNGHWRIQKPNFRIKFNMPLKFPIHMNYANNYEEIDESGSPPPPDYDGLGMPDAGAYGNGDAVQQENEAANSEDNSNQQYTPTEEENGQSNDNGNDIGQLPVYSDKPKFKVTPIITLGGKLPSEYEPSYSSTNNNAANNDGSQAAVVDKIPYTGKAQVSSFIDNGQFINAHQTNVVMKNNHAPKDMGDRGLVDEAFEDQLEGAYGKTESSSSSSSTLEESNNQSGEGSRREDIRRSKIVGPLMMAKKVKMLKIPLYAKKLALNDHSKIHTVRLGYKGAPAESSFITQYEATPDAVPLSLPRHKYSNYYSSLSFTNGMHGIPYEPVGFGPIGTLKWMSRMFNKPGIVVPPVKYRLPTKHVHIG